MGKSLLVRKEGGQTSWLKLGFMGCAQRVTRKEDQIAAKIDLKAGGEVEEAA